MNVIEAMQQAATGKLIRNGKLKRINHFLKYMGSDVFYEYELSGQGVDVKKKYKYDIKNFPIEYVFLEAVQFLMIEKESIAGH
jgi:hypothetical protein